MSQSRAQIQIVGRSLHVAELSDTNALVMTTDHADEIQLSMIVSKWDLQRWLMDYDDLERRKLVQDKQIAEALVTPE